MLGITHTYIECDRVDCRYNSGFGAGMCSPPINYEHGNEVLRLKNGKCILYSKLIKKKCKKKFKL